MRENLLISTGSRKITVIRVSQDDPLREVFRDDSGMYFATTRLPHLQFMTQHTLIVEQARIETRIKDQNDNQF